MSFRTRRDPRQIKLIQSGLKAGARVADAALALFCVGAVRGWVKVISLREL